MVGAQDIELDSDIHNRKALEDMSAFNETFFAFDVNTPEMQIEPNHSPRRGSLNSDEGLGQPRSRLQFYP